MSFKSRQRIEQNIVFGTYSGLALLLDVHHPAQSNGRAILVVPGSGWTSQQTYDAPLLTALGSSVRFFLPALLRAGYTLFVANHRNGPRFRYPAAVEDVGRAVRYIRDNAARYGIDANRIGAMGYSSGAHLAALLGVTAQVQCVVAAALPADLARFQSPELAVFMGQVIALPGGSPDPIAVEAYRDASPVTHVSASSAPMLLLHGDADAILPFEMSEIMRHKLNEAGVDVKLIGLAGGGHDFAGDASGHPGWPDFFAESAAWMDRHLKPAVVGQAVWPASR